MQGERIYETFIELKVIAPLIGDGPNQEGPVYSRRESAVDVKIARERTVLDPDAPPERIS